ncbi:MAG TPA: winged helix-turn-helix domain-containing protein [Candidatus Krumholzibacteriaceae bacterium]|jgi:predicted transcriptional regulator|nr:winged helix-turn-helix domain-containing protein [Candidatus Krumholzibacteriaceae bacterium]
MVDSKEPFSERGAVDIVAAILEASVEETRKTTIMFKAQLSFRQLYTYLPWLVNHRYLEVCINQGFEIYKITEKGTAYLETYRLLKAILKS